MTATQCRLKVVVAAAAGEAHSLEAAAEGGDSWIAEIAESAAAAEAAEAAAACL